MNLVLWWLVQNTITVALLIPFVAVACRLCRERPAVQHVLWAVLLLKFVTPQLVAWPWHVQNLSVPLTSIMAPALRSELCGTDERHPFVLDQQKLGANAAVPIEEVVGHSSRVPVAAAGLVPSIAKRDAFARLALGLAAGAWFVGVVICTGRQVRRIRKHASFVRRARKAPEALTMEIEAIAMRVGLRPPLAVVTQGIASPFMWFLGRLRLVWPEAMSRHDEVVRSRGVIAHELAHVRRGDHYLAWVELIAGVVWWWNPLFWFVRRRVRESSELACDAIALSACPESRRTYAELLLELSSGSGSASLAPVLGIRASTVSSFERRLSMILSDRVSAKTPMWGFLAAAGLAVVMLPGWSLAQKPGDDAGRTSSEKPSPSSQSARATAARLVQIEAELQRLSGLLEEAKRSAANSPQETADPLQREISARWRDGHAPWLTLKVIGKDPTVYSFKGASENYIVTTKDEKAYVSALDKEGRQLWHVQLPVAPRVGDVGEWVLKEWKDRKQVVISWISQDERNSFHLDAESGKTIMEMITARDGFYRPADTELVNAPVHRAGQPDSPSVADKLRSLNARSDQANLVERDHKLAKSDQELTQEIFRGLLNRNPTPDELAHAIKHIAAATTAGNRGRAVEDLFWVIINSREYQSPQKPQAARR